MNKYVTEYYKNGKLFGDIIEAQSWEEAQFLCDVRRSGEKVVGKLIEVIEICMN